MFNVSGVKCLACAVALALISTSAIAEKWIEGAVEFQAGELCLSKLPATAVRQLKDHVINTEVWTEIAISIGHSGAPRIFVLDSPPTLESLGPGFHDCAEIASKSKRIILEAEINKLQAKGYARRPAEGKGFGVDIRSLSGELGHIRSDLDSVMGGSLSLADSKAWINQQGPIVGTGDSVTGVIRLEAWHRQIKGARITVGDTSITADLDTPDEKNAEFNIDLSTGTATLFNGRYRSTKLSPQVKSISIAGLDFGEVSKLTIESLTLNARAGSLSMSASKLNVGAKSMVVNSQGSLALANPIGTIEAFAGSAKQSVESVQIYEPAINGAILKATGIGSAHGALDGTVFVDLPLWGLKAVKGTVRIEADKVQRLGFMLSGNQLPTVDLLLGGTPEKLNVSGSTQLNGLLLATLRAESLSGKINIPTFSIVDGKMEIPLAIDVTSPQGKLTIVDANSSVTLSGELRRFHLSGNLRLGFDIEEAELVVPKDGLQLGLSAGVTVVPLLVGAKEQQINGTVDVKSETPLTIREMGSTGTLSLGMGLVTIVDPVIQIGSGTSNTLQGNLSSEASVLLAYDLGTQDYKVSSGKFFAKDVKAVARPGAQVVAGDVTFAEPDFSIGKVEVTVENGKGRAALEKLTFAAQQISHNSSDAARQIQTWSIYLPQPFEIASLSADVKVSKEGFKTENEQLKGLKLIGTGFHYRSVDGSSEFESSSAQISLSIVSNNELAGSFKIGSGSMKIHSAIRGQASLESVELNLSGSKSRPIGSGTIVISSIDVVIRGDHDPASVWATHCNSEKPKLDTYVKTTTRSVLPVVTDAGGFKGTAKLGRTLASVGLPDGQPQSCDWEGSDNVDWQVGCINGACWKEHWKFDYGARYTLNAASLSIISESATIDVASDDRKDTNKRICMGTFVVVSPMVYMPSVSTWLKTPIGGVIGDLLTKAQQLITGIGTGITNSVYMAIANPILLVDSLTSTVDQKTLCFN